MLGKTTRPLILTKLPDPLTSPKCSLELRILTPRTSLKNSSDPAAGIGLGIVAALGCGTDVSVSAPVGGLRTDAARSNPIPIQGTKYCNSSSEDDGAGHDRSGCADKHSSVRPALPPLDFLNSCGLCRKKLHGRDIYMYRGEKGFCSAECRCRQIIIDERKEKCGSELSSRSVDMSSSPYSRDNIFFTGIIVA